MPKTDTIDIIDGLETLRRILEGARGILTLPVSLNCDPQVRDESLKYLIEIAAEILPQVDQQVRELLGRVPKMPGSSGQPERAGQPE